MRLRDLEYRMLDGAALAALGAAALLFLAPAVPAAGASESIVVKIVINGEVKGDYFAAIGEQNEVFLKRDDLVLIGLQAGQRPFVEINGIPYVSIRELGLTEYRFDEKTLSLFLTVPSSDLASRPVIDLLPQRPARLFIPDEFSAFLNYSVNYFKTDPLGLDTITLTNKGGMHAGKFLFLTDTIYTKTDEQQRFVRLLSTMTYEERDQQRRYIVGDSFASSGSLGSTINVGGISIAKVYAIDPFFIKRPMFHASGIASLPSDASIYVDGALVRREHLAPGAFEIRNLNYYGGAHSVDVVVRDPFGNENRMSYPAYYSDAVLGRGLQEYNYTVGAFRKYYGIKSNEYEELAFSAYHRYGMTNSFTLGGWTEGSDGLYAAGPEGAYVLPFGGTVAANFGVSKDGGSTGNAGSLSYSFRKNAVAVGLFVRSFSRDYVNIASRTAADRPRREEGIGASYTAGYQGSLAVDLTSFSRYESGEQKIASVTYSRSVFRNLLAYITVRTIRTESGDAHEVFLGLNYSPAKNVYVTAQYTSTAAVDASAVRIEKTVPTGEGLGYHVGIDTQRTDAGTATSTAPGMLYRGRYGTYFADYRYSSAPTGHGEQYSVTAAGALVYGGGFFGFSRPVNDSFGILKVDALSGVDVTWNGEPMGKTDGNGRLVIPELRSYNVNQITLDPGDVALDYRLEKVGMDVSPAQWSGACLSVRADRMQAFTGRLVTSQDGRSVPIEFISFALTNGERTAQLLTGQNGEFYFENTALNAAGAGVTALHSCGDRRMAADEPEIMPSARLTVVFRHQNKSCSAKLLVPAVTDIIVDIGDVIVTCQ